MSLPQWMRQFAQQWLPRNGKRTGRRYAVRTRRRVHPHLEVLEDRLTPSGDVLAFSTATHTLDTEGSSAPITVQLQNSSGTPELAASNVTVNLSSSSSGGQFFDTSGHALSNSRLIIPKGASSASFTYEDNQVGTPILQAKAPTLNLGTSQQESVDVWLENTSTGQKIAPGQASQPIGVRLFSQYPNLFTATNSVTVQLTSSSPTGEFLDASGKVLPNGRLTIPAGSSAASFEYKDSQAGLPQLSETLGGSSIQTSMNVGVSVVFTTAPQNLKAGQKSQPITVQMQDSHGNAIVVPNTANLSLSSNSPTGTFLDSQGNLFPSLFSIPAGTSSVSFVYEDSLGGKPTLGALITSGIVLVNPFSDALNGPSMSATQQETVTGPYKVVLGTPSQTISPNHPSSPIKIQLFDSTGNVAVPKSATTVQLTSTSRTGQFLDAKGNVLTNGRLTIPAGSGSASFEYKDSQAGFPTLTASVNGSTSQQQVNVGVSMAFTTPAQSLKAGQTSGTITVQLQDSNGKPVIAPSMVPIYLTWNSSNGQLLDSSGNPLPYPLSDPNIGIQAGTSSFSFKYKDSMGGTPTLTAMALVNPRGLLATQQETVAGPYWLLLPQSPFPMTDQNEASQPISVQLFSNGSVAKATSAVTIQLTSSSRTGQFLDASGNVLPNGRLTIPAGSGSASFEYKDSQAGFPTLTATENGFKATTQVNVGVSMVFTTPAQNFKTGQSSGTITVQLQDSHGKTVTAPGDLYISLNSSLGTVQFLGLPSPSVPYSVLIPAGASSASFAITSNWGGTAVLTASQPSLALSATQKETIQGLSGLVFTTPPQTVAVGQKSQRVTLQLVDNNGKAAVAPSGGLTIYLTGNTPGLMGPSPSKFFDGNGTPLPTGTTPYFNGFTLLIPAGSSTVSFQVESTQAGAMPLFALINNGPSSQQMETFLAGPPKSLVFETPAQTQAAGMPSGSITVQLQDQYGNPIAAGSSGLTFTLHSSSSSGTFLSANGDPLANSTITLLPGLSSATFEYKDSRVGTPTLTATAKGVSGTQKESITPVAAEIHVTNTHDSGTGSLRSAMEAANAHPGSTIVFDAGVRGTIDLMRALPAITANMNIVGPGANLLTLERSALSSRGFGIFVVDGVNITVNISGLTVANGSRTGITNMGYLTLQRVVVANNHDDGATAYPGAAGLPYGAAGGIENFGTLTILNSTIANNTTTRSVNAAGIDSQSGSVLIVNSTISGNQGINSYRTGGIYISGGTALIENSTISGNSTSPRWNTSSGGIDSDGQVTLYDTIVAGNIGSASNPTDVFGAFISLGHNLFGRADQQSSGFASSDLLGSIGKPFDPKLGALANNGGPTPTMAPLAGSLALRMGSSVDAPSTDQRGDPRPHGAIDIGAFEVTTS